MKKKLIFCDCLVVGAGVSGVAAAVTASRKGFKTILLEKNSFPGGTAVIAMHRYLCGAYPGNSGILKEVIKGIACGKKLLRMGKVSVLPFKTENLINCLKKLIRNENNLKIIYKAKANSVKIKNNSILSVVAKLTNGEVQVIPKVVIEATGTGEIIKLCKAKYKLEAAQKRQLAGFSIKIKGIGLSASLLNIKVPYFVKFSNFYPGDNKEEGFIKFSVIPAKVKSIKNYAGIQFAYLKKMIPGLNKAYIEKISPEIKEREGIRILGEYILTKADVLKAKKFSDAIARGYWPIEFWYPKIGPKLKYLKPGEYYEIPERCLKSKNIPNLIVTGKCISATPEALSSTRVMGTCISLGEAAGSLASRYINLK